MTSLDKVVEPVVEEKGPDPNEELIQKLRELDVPEEVCQAAPKWKQRFGGIRYASLGDTIYIFRKLKWGDMKDITASLSNLAKSPNANEPILRMADLELQLEKAILFPKLTVESAREFPSGDLETLQELITEYSGYVQMPPLVEDL
jgi:hypothetical protein